MIASNARYAVRQLIKAPAFTLTCIVTLAVGIGANSAIFSVVNVVLLRPSGVVEPQRVAVLKVRHSRLGLDVPYVSVPDYSDAASLKEQVESVAIARSAGFNILLDNFIERLPGARVSSHWFQVFGARPILGRTFTEEEDQPNASPVVVLSYSAWQTFFGGHADVVGKKLILDQEPYQVIGVMGSDFVEPKGRQIWVPIALPRTDFAANQRFRDDYRAVIRLRPGVSLGQLNAGLTQKVEEALRQYPGNSYANRSGWAFYATSFTEFSAGTLATPLRLLFAGVALVLLIASANVAGLVLARSAARSKDFTIQMALGASTKVLLRQALIDSVFLSFATVLVGAAIGPALGKLLVASLPSRIVQGFTVQMDTRVLAFTTAAGLAATFLTGIGPALRIVWQGRHLRLNESSRNSTGSAGVQKLHNGFVIGQIALACVLLSITGLFLTSLRKLQQANLGFQPRNMLAAQVVYSGRDFKADPARQSAFINGVLDQLAGQPGMQSAAAVEPIPFDPDRIESSSFSIENRPSQPGISAFQSDEAYATAAYLTVAQIPLLSGRWFTNEDRADTLPVVVIDETIARKYWPSESALGQRLRTSDQKPWATIIGVVGSVNSRLLEGTAGNGLRYYPFAQGRDVAVNFVVRCTDGPAGFRPAIKAAIAAVGQQQAVSSITPMEEIVSNLFATRTLIVYLLAAFAAFALLLAVLGVYGLTSYLTTQRTQEIGIRMALGAQRFDVMWLVLSRTLWWTFLGLGIGLIVSFGAIRFLRHLIFTVENPTMNLIMAALPLMVAAVVAGSVVAFRTAFIDPLHAIQNE